MTFKLLVIFFITPICYSRIKILSFEYINFINLKQNTWIAGNNFPNDTPLEVLKNLNGERIDHDFYSNLEIKTHNITKKIPESFDARNYWPQCESLHKIRNQGYCGSCWAFGAVSAMSDRLCILTNGSEKFQFSAEDLLSCCTDCGDGCMGGYSSKAWAYWVTNGIVSGGDYNSSEGCRPYSQKAFEKSSTPECTPTCDNSNYGKSYADDKRYGFNNYKISQDIEQIQAEIMTNGPVQASYIVFEDFYNYKSGVYQHINGDKSGYHAVKILGWGIENKTPYWLIANSWGVQWGDSGFFKILRGENHCNIEENIVGGNPRI